MSYNIAIFLLLLPFGVFLLNSLAGKRFFKSASGIPGTIAMGIAFCISCMIAFNYFFKDHQDGAYQSILVLKYSWLRFSENLSIDMGILLDPIAVMMIVVVTFISFMVHVYSLEYMKDEPRKSVYFAFLSLFTFSMLGLVLSSNIFQTYLFWELVGLSSYLLIGFYYNKETAVSAAKKAFIVTRFADLGFLVGILLLSGNTGSFDFQTIIGAHSAGNAFQGGTLFLGLSSLTWALIMIFIGCAGKSAMFPLHIWLPDAMEGPTPVSALIHAATMVVAGVYLVARLFPLYAADEIASMVITVVGTFSALFAAIIACTQTDIKRVLAYSTMSQIGYMMLALGVGGSGDAGNSEGFTASLFHLFTHAMFKALLFLAAGAIIHFVHSNELNAMGDLRKKMPVTHFTFLVACLAIAGIPPFSGFFSKEEILLAAWHSNKVVFVTGIITAALTAFYMFRLYFRIFWYKESVQDKDPVDKHHHSEGGWAMKWPLLILALLAIVSGFIPFNRLITSSGMEMPSEFHPEFSITPVLLALTGILTAMAFYKKENQRPEKMVTALQFIYGPACKKFYIDELYQFITKKIIFNYIGKTSAWIDRNIIDGLVNRIAWLTERLSAFIKTIQSGQLQDYGIYLLSGTLAFVLWFICLKN